MQAFINQYRFIVFPFITWFGIQLFKLFYDYFETKQFHLSRFMGSGGMPSSHSATVTCLATLIGKHIGIGTPIFSISFFFALVVMYDAAGVRRAVGKQAKVLNQIIFDEKLSNAEKLQEMTGHTPIQVSVGFLIGLIVGLIF